MKVVKIKDTLNNILVQSTLDSIEKQYFSKYLLLCSTEEKNQAGLIPNFVDLYL